MKKWIIFFVWLIINIIIIIKFNAAFTGIYFGTNAPNYIYAGSISWFAVDLSPKIRAPAIIRVFDHSSNNNQLKFYMMDYLPAAGTFFQSMDTKFNVVFQVENQGNTVVRYFTYDDALATANRKVLLMCNSIVTQNKVGHVTVELI